MGASYLLEGVKPVVLEPGVLDVPLRNALGRLEAHWVDWEESGETGFFGKVELVSYQVRDVAVEGPVVVCQLECEVEVELRLAGGGLRRLQRDLSVVAQLTLDLAGCTIVEPASVGFQAPDPEAAGD